MRGILFCFVLLIVSRVVFLDLSCRCACLGSIQSVRRASFCDWSAVASGWWGRVCALPSPRPVWVTCAGTRSSPPGFLSWLKSGDCFFGPELERVEIPEFVDASHVLTRLRTAVPEGDVLLPPPPFFRV